SSSIAAAPAYCAVHRQPQATLRRTKHREITLSVKLAVLIGNFTRRQNLRDLMSFEYSRLALRRFLLIIERALQHTWQYGSYRLALSMTILIFDGGARCGRCYSQPRRLK